MAFLRRRNGVWELGRRCLHEPLSLASEKRRDEAAEKGKSGTTPTNDLDRLAIPCTSTENSFIQSHVDLAFHSWWTYRACAITIL